MMKDNDFKLLKQTDRWTNEWTFVNVVTFTTETVFSKMRFSLLPEPKNLKNL